ncbi:DUF4139 domain-containing protein [uncultured Sphingomonas sp.]|uniref:DUF4139 domain-containing protein n=1 Tax=uncultured Sphingomonas sp. TaxID=158754 RepID=UPI0035CB2652
MTRSILLLMAVVPAAASAQAVPPAASGGSAQGDVSVTIYANNALVQDTRQLTLPAGVSRQEFPDVSSEIRPATVRLSADGTTIVEQNYDYDLLSPRALMDKAVGQTITLVRTNPATGAETREQARVLASNDGVILQIGSRIEVLRDDGLPVRVVFDSLPPNLRARPTLSVTLDTRSGGRRPVTISYLTGGLSWSADYVALFDEAKSTIDVQGWITLGNNGGTTYVNADTLLVAGSSGGNTGSGRGLAPDTRPGTQTAGRARLGDFYLYPLGHRTTIAANQQKQVSFLSVGGVAAHKLYAFRNGWLGSDDEPRSADTVIGFSTAREGGLGDALPAGTVRVYMRDAKGQPQFVGENGIDHMPMGSELAIKTGEAFDVKVKPAIDKRERILSDEWERTARYRITVKGQPTRTVEEARNVIYWRTAMRYVLTNARPEAVMVDVSQAGLDNTWEDTRVSAESQPGDQRSLDERVWHVRVPANGTATLTATFDTRY